MQARLPDNLEEITLRDMIEGESGYTTPWAMFADGKGYLWLNGSYTFSKIPGGTATLKITRLNGSFAADISECKDEKWELSDDNPWLRNSPLPVSKLLGN